LLYAMPSNESVSVWVRGVDFEGAPHIFFDLHFGGNIIVGSFQSVNVRPCKTSFSFPCTKMQALTLLHPHRLKKRSQHVLVICTPSASSCPSYTPLLLLLVLLFSWARFSSASGQRLFCTELDTVGWVANLVRRNDQSETHTHDEM
jgi:hypothetical protein